MIHLYICHKLTLHSSSKHTYKYICIYVHLGFKYTYTYIATLILTWVLFHSSPIFTSTSFFRFSVLTRRKDESPYLTLHNLAELQGHQRGKVSLPFLTSWLLAGWVSSDWTISLTKWLQLAILPAVFFLETPEMSNTAVWSTFLVYSRGSTCLWELLAHSLTQWDCYFKMPWRAQLDKAPVFRFIHRICSHFMLRRLNTRPTRGNKVQASFAVKFREVKAM